MFADGGTVTNAGGRSITGGTFTATSTVTNNPSAIISGGGFSGTVNNGYESVTNYGKVSGGDFSNATSLKNIFRVTFDLDGGTASGQSAIATQYRAYTMVTKPYPEPTKDDLNFVGWYSDDTLWSFGNTAVTKDITLKAKWSVQQYATVVKEPESITGLVYNGAPQALITEGTANNGTMVYGINDGDLGTDIPTATKPGTYKICYKAVAGTNKGVRDGSPQYMYVDIAKATPKITVLPTVSATVYAGDTLTSTALSGGKAIDIDSIALAGSFTVTDTVLDAGENIVTVTFTPNDSTNYGTVTTTITVTAAKHAITSITTPEPITDKTCGTAIDSLGLPTAVTVSGDGFTGTAAVTWDTSGYNAYSTQAQIFTAH